MTQRDSALVQRKSLDNIKFMEYDEKYYDQMIEMYKTNLPRTHSPRGYDYLTMPIADQGLFIVLSVLALIFGLLYLALFKFVHIGVIVAIYIGLIHFYCFYYAERQFVSTQIWYAGYIVKTFLNKENIKKRFSGNNKLFMAVDTEKDIIVGMATYDTTFENTLNLPVNEAGEVGRVSVRGEYGGRGIAVKIMKMIEEHARQINKKYIFLSCLDSNKRGVPFYEKFGFVKDPIRVFRPVSFKFYGVNVLFMKKVLS